MQEDESQIDEADLLSLLRDIDVIPVGWTAMSNNVLLLVADLEKGPGGKEITERRIAGRGKKQKQTPPLPP